MFRILLDDPLFSSFPGPDLTGSPDLTDITFAGQRHVTPLQGPVEKTTGPDGISQREEPRMIYCGIHETDHTPAELAECLKNSTPPASDDDE
jgi:hypothetical protein